MNQTKKVVLVGPVYPFRGGIAHHSHFLDNAFQQLGCQTQVISFARQYPAWLYPGRTDRDPSPKARPANASYPLDPLYPWTWRQAARTILTSRPNLVIFQWWTTFWSIPFTLIARHLKSCGLPVIFIIHNVFPHEPHLWDVSLARLALSSADILVTQTEQEKDKVLSIIPDASVHTCLIPMFTMPIGNLPDHLSAKKHLGLPENEICLLFFGLVRPYKGLRYLLDALGLLRRSELKPHLVIAGEFWEDKKIYLHQIEDLHLTQQIHIFDHYIPDDEVAWYLAAADVFVAPYIQGTTQSAAATIARAFGIPMIITEQVQQGLTEDELTVIQVVPPKDANALAQAIHSTLDNYAHRSRMITTPKIQQADPLSLAEAEWKRFAQVILNLV